VPEQRWPVRRIGQLDRVVEEATVGNRSCQMAGPGAPFTCMSTPCWSNSCHDVEARVAAVQNAEAIAARLDLEGGPALPVDGNDVAEELRDQNGCLSG